MRSKLFIWASIFILLIGAVVTSIFLSTRKETTDSRSKASTPKTASVLITNIPGQPSVWAVGINGSAADPTVKVSSISAEISLSLPSSFGTAQAEKEQICLDNVVTQDERYYWKDTCKGSKKVTSCIPKQVPLSRVEEKRYRSWVDAGSPKDQACQSLQVGLGTQMEGNAPVKASASAGYRDLYDDSYISIATKVSVLNFAKPVVKVDMQKKEVLISVFIQSTQNTPPSLLHSDIELLRVALLPGFGTGGHGVIQKQSIQ